MLIIQVFILRWTNHFLPVYININLGQNIRVLPSYAFDIIWGQGLCSLVREVEQWYLGPAYTCA